MSAVREAWTDERLDDFRGSVDAGFAQMHEDHADFRAELKVQGSEFREEMKGLGSELREEMRAQGAELREEMRAVSAELRQETRDLRGEMHAGFERMERRFDWLTRTIVVALIGLVITHFV